MIRNLPPVIALILLAYAIAVVLVLSTPARAGETCGLKASWYGSESGSRTASGERYTGNDMTAAHRTWPFGTKVRVTYAGRSVVVRINDRGPFIKGRSLDLSRAAAAKLGMIEAGVADVCLTRLN